MKYTLWLLLLFATPLFAQFTYAPVNVPGALATAARGVNMSGEVAGFYKTTACSDYNLLVSTCRTKGFKYVNGSYIKLMVPGSVSTAILGLNDYGDLVGFYSIMQSGCSLPVYHGFIWYHTNTIRKLDAPGTGACPSSNGGPVTAAMGINKAGTVVGGIWFTGGNGAFPGDGFVWANGTFSTMGPSAPNGVAPCCWSVNGIANNGVIAGNLFQNDYFMAWFKQGTDQDFYTYVDDTYGTGVDSQTDVVGYSAVSGGYFAKHIELNESSNDASEVNPSFIPVQFPGAAVSYPFALNDSRWVAGTYQDSNGAFHGFVAKPTF